MPADPRLLQALLDEMRVDELLSLVTLEEIAEAWFRYQVRPHIDGVEDEDPDWWAVELLTTMDYHFKSDELRIRATLDLLIDHAHDDDALGGVAAGPLEDFVKAAGEQRLRWIERRADESPRFRQALRGLGVAPAAGCLFRLERAAAAPSRDEDVIIEVVPGDLPGTVHIQRNGVTVAELESGPGRHQRHGRADTAPPVTAFRR